MRYALILFISVAVLLYAGASVAACSLGQPVFSELVARDSVTLSGPLTVEELERKNLIEIRETRKKLPFGYSNESWLRFKASVAPEDTIYFMVKREGSFYQDGHILVRNGCVVHFLLGAIS